MTARELYRPPSSLQPSPAEIADWTGGSLADAKHAPERLTGLSTLAEARPDELSFVVAATNKQAALASQAGLVIAPKDLALEGRARVLVDHVWPAVVEVMKRLYTEPEPKVGVHPTAFIEKSVRIGRRAAVGPFCYVGEHAEIGEGAVLGPHCSIDAHGRIGAESRLHGQVTLQGLVHVGERVVIHSGAVLGADGFKFEPGRGQPLKIPQVGIVIVEHDVEIGANTTIDRAFLHETRIGAGTKIDNQVQVGHNCSIGRNCLIAGCVGIAGSVTIGDQVLIGGGAKLRDNITVGRGAMIVGMSTVAKDVPPGAVLLGHPAIALKDYQRAMGYFPRLPQMAARLRELERQIQLALAR